METVQVATRLDKNIKIAASKVLEREGLDLPTLFKIIATKTANDGAIPLMFNKPIQKSLERIALEKQLSELIKPRLKDAEFVDLNDPETVKKMVEDGWEEW